MRERTMRDRRCCRRRPLTWRGCRGRGRRRTPTPASLVSSTHSLSPSLLPSAACHTVPLTDYAQAQFRQYDRLTKQLKPDMEIYEKQKMEM